MGLIACVTRQHDLLLVVLAAIVCCIGAWVTVTLQAAVERQRRAGAGPWIFLGAVATGATVWCTHFVAMLAYDPGVALAYTAGWTALSFVAGLATSGLGLLVSLRPSRAATVCGGAITGLGFAVVHYMGMLALSADAVILWSPTPVAVSLALATLLSAGSRHCASRMAMPRAAAAGTALLVLAILSLHFVGMSALTILPRNPVADMLTTTDARGAMALAVALVGLLVVGTGGASYMLERQTGRRNQARLRYLLGSTVDGMVLEENGCIIEANDAFAKLVGSAPGRLPTRFLDLVEGGETLAAGSLVQARLKTAEGLVPVEIYCRDEIHRDGAPGLRVYAVRDLRARLSQERRIEQLAWNDALTGLPNRAHFLDHLESRLRRPPVGASLALLVMDLNGFKGINDSHGHGAGDAMLRAFSQRVRASLRPEEYVARLGGDEFVAIVDVASREEAAAFARRIANEACKPGQRFGEQLSCGISIGIALSPQDASDASSLMNQADLAMYRAKASRTETYCFFDYSMDAVVRARRKTLSDLREGMKRDEFEVHYQVQTSVQTGEITGYEALIRWRHPEHGYVPPADFIPLAEDSGLIVELGAWVLRRACEEAARWRDPHKLAVNLSAVQLAHGELVPMLRRTLAESGLCPTRLELEITETALIRDAAKTLHVLAQIKRMDVSIAMDDFGTGYSSLSTLKAFPFDKIKLDKTFLDEIEGSPQARAILKAVLALGGSLRIPVLAEGVETADQLQFLRQEGCDEAQGYLLGRPTRAIPARDEADWLRAA